MQTPSEYRKQAEDLVIKAQTAPPEQRVRLLQMAQSFIRLADEAELLKSDANERLKQVVTSGGVAGIDSAHGKATARIPLGDNSNS